MKWGRISDRVELEASRSAHTNRSRSLAAAIVGRVEGRWHRSEAPHRARPPGAQVAPGVGSAVRGAEDSSGSLVRWMSMSGPSSYTLR